MSGAAPSPLRSARWSSPAATRSSPRSSSMPAGALYFSKAPVPWGEGPHYEHIGLYAYRRAALERFVTLPRGILEERERLEQLRALEAGMRISVSLIDPARLGVQVDTPADLARARQLVEAAASVIPAKAGTQAGRDMSSAPHPRLRGGDDGRGLKARAC